jgi:hypothetical protein
MKRVMPVDLKAKPSEYPREALTGETVARLRPPRPGAPTPRDLPMPPPLETDLDAVDILLEDRWRER